MGAPGLGEGCGVSVSLQPGQNGPDLAMEKGQGKQVFNPEIVLGVKVAGDQRVLGQFRGGLEHGMKLPAALFQVDAGVQVEVDQADGAQGCGRNGGQGNAAAVVDLEDKPGQMDDLGVLQGVAAENGQSLSAVFSHSLSRGEEIVIAEVFGKPVDYKGAPIGMVLDFLEKEQIGLEELDPFQFPLNFAEGSLGGQIQAGGCQAEGRGADRLVESAESGGDLQAHRPGTAVSGDG